MLVAQGDGPSNLRDQAGEVYVFFGPTSTWAPVTDLSVDRPDVQIFGRDVVDSLKFSTIADVVGDPIGDLLLAAAGGDGPSNQRLQSGEIYVLRGRVNWPAVIDLRVDAPDLLVYGRGVENINEGEFVNQALVNDWNRDGEPDLLIGGGSSRYTNGRGAIHVLLGRSGLSGVWDLQTRPADCAIVGPRDLATLGLSQIQLGDFDGDGFEELFAGANADTTP